MKLSNKIVIAATLFFVISCDLLMKNDDKYVETYDDQLIEEIQNANNKIEIDYNDLPANILLTIESSYYTQTFLSELSAEGLGYELTHSDISTDEYSFKKIYFDVDGRKLISRKEYNKDRKECFELVYPVVFILPDGSAVTVENNSEEGWIDLKEWYDDNPDSEGRPQMEYPVEISFEDGSLTTINSEDEMRETKDSCFDRCIEFVYPITFILPDESTVTVVNDSEESWLELKDWYEENPSVEFEWNIQYPVDVRLYDGSIETVNSLSEIESLKQGCD